MHLQEPKFLFWFTSDTVLQETCLSISRLLREVLQGGLQAKMVPEIDYLLHFWRSPASVPQASHQADYVLTCCQEQKPQEPTRTSWLQEKGLWEIIPNSRVSHPLHSYAFGYYSQSKYDFPWDWLQEARHMARVHGKACCTGFHSKEGLDYWLEWSVRNQLERDQVQRALEKSSGSCLWQTTINLIHKFGNPLQFQSWAVLRWLCGGLCHARKCQFEDFDKKKYDLQSPNWRLHEKPLQRKAKQGEKADTNSGTRYPQVSYLKKMHDMSQKHRGACVM